LLLEDDGDLDISLQVSGTQEENPRITIAAIANNRFQERDLERLANMVDAESLRRPLPRVRESAGGKAVSESIRKAAQENMVPDATDRHCGQCERRRGDWVRGADRQSGEGAAGCILGCTEHSLDLSPAQCLAGALTANFTVILFQEAEHAPRIVAE
jgi:hypothetical protein